MRARVANSSKMQNYPFQISHYMGYTALTYNLPDFPVLRATERDIHTKSRMLYYHVYMAGVIRAESLAMSLIKLASVKGAIMIMALVQENAGKHVHIDET